MKLSPQAEQYLAKRAREVRKMDREELLSLEELQAAVEAEGQD